jgi:hypothetical protein
LLPLVARSDGWRRYSGDVLRLEEEGLDLLQIGAQQVDQETRQVVTNRIQEMGRSRAHRRWRNRPDELADAAVSDERLRLFGGVSRRRRKGRWRRSARGSYSCS